VIRRGLRVALALAATAAAGGALYWAFLNTPESNLIMLALSGLLTVLLVTAVAAGVNTSILFAHGVSAREAIGTALRGIGWFVLAAIPVVLTWWAVARADAWIVARQGEITAWFIARWDWADIGGLLQAELWVSRWLRWAVAPLVSLSLLGAFLRQPRGNSTLALRRALHWRTLGAVTLTFILLFALPWQLTAWRPNLPPTWLEPAVAALRLGTVLLLALAGASLMIFASTAERSSDPLTANRRDPHV
jgi:hypothetical protein